jgi:hypothetical protein
MELTTLPHNLMSQNLNINQPHFHELTTVHKFRNMDQLNL